MATTEKRGPGRPPLYDGEKMAGRTIRLPRELWDKVDAAGGVAWLRALIARARLPRRD